jgi:hypothetical protein
MFFDGVHVTQSLLHAAGEILLLNLIDVGAEEGNVGFRADAEH